MRLPYRMVSSFKGALFIGAVAIILGVSLYTNSIVNGLREHSRRYVTLKVERFKNLFLQGDEALDVYLREMATKDFPLIVADTKREPTSWSGLPDLEELPDSVARPRARRLMRGWESQGNKPIPLEMDIANIQLKFYFYYGDSDQIRRLKSLPWIMMFMTGILILIGYVGFVNIKKSEERSVWVGMARETAHQMGTPLTSLLGWVELLGEPSNEKMDIDRIRQEMQSDIERLAMVAERFNRIGSESHLRQFSLEDLVNDAVVYIRRRLPQLASGEVKINAIFTEKIDVAVNPDLFSWVIENLLRNGVEALHGEGGDVTIHGRLSGNKAIVDVKDTGKGIPRSQWRNIFRPGFSTKQRGWGLGLSLARRIIEDVHHGRIVVAESKVGFGTTIRIQLPVGTEKAG